MFYGRLYGKGSGVTCLGWFWEERKIPGLAMGEFLGDSYSLFWSYIDTYALYEFLSKKYRRWWWRERGILGLLVKQAEAIQMSKHHMHT
jgi:hypothetical protein